MAKMKDTVFVSTALKIAEDYNTAYIWGGIGSPITEANIAKAEKQYEKNTTNGYAAEARKLIGQNGFAFDCVGLIKSILWGWNGNSGKTYGGATYGSNGVPDTNADGMIDKCSEASTDFTGIVPGAVVWMKGHIGIYIGDGKVVESTPSWNGGVQVSTCRNLKSKKITGTVGVRKWTKWGKLPYVEYGVAVTQTESKAETKPEAKSEAKSETKSEAVKVAPAASRDKSASKGVVFTVNARSGLNVRSSPEIPDDARANILKAVVHGTIVTWYGYYTGDWYLVQFRDKSTGFVNKRYLRKMY